MSTFFWVLGTNLVTTFVMWRLMAFYAHHLPAVVAQLQGSKLHDHLTDEDVAWIKEQAGKNPDWLRRPSTSSATTAGQDPTEKTTSSSSSTQTAG
jgi:predicted RNase H-like nuclease